MLASYHVTPDAQKALRAALFIPAGSPGFAEGGAAVASLDGKVRLYDMTGASQGLLAGHTGGVVDLAISHDGSRLVSGSWDGTAVVWDLATKSAVATLGDHENAVCVACLPSGNIVTGSTGRKNASNQHVDYKVRIWAPTGTSAYTCTLTLQDHNQAVRSVTAVPGGGCATGSNDGTVKLRGSSGTTTTTWEMPAPDYASGVPAFVFGVTHLPASVADPSVEGAAAGDHPGYVAACCEDGCVRLYELAWSGGAGSSEVVGKGLVATIPVAGVPWAVVPVGAGRLAIACNQAGTSRRGHVYLFSSSAANRADDVALAKFEKDLAPPPKGTAGGGGGSGGGGASAIKSQGHYDTRASIPGSADGQYGFFHKDDGGIWACAWDAKQGAWVDIGQVTDGPGDAGVGMEASPTYTAPDGKTYQHSRTVDVDAGSGRMQSMTLAWNDGETAVDVTKRFLLQNGLGMENYDQVRDFVLQQMGPGSAAAPAPAAPQYSTLPNAQHTFMDTINFGGAFRKLKSNNEALAAEGSGVALAGAADEAGLQALQEVAEKRAFYHSSPFPPSASAVLSRKLLQWPAASIGPVLDVTRLLFMHTNAAAAMSSPATFGVDVVQVLLQHMTAEASSAGLRVLATRALVNAFSKSCMHSHLASNLPSILDAVSTVMNLDASSSGVLAKAHAAATHVLLNCATLMAQQTGSTSLDTCEALLGVALVALSQPDLAGNLQTAKNAIVAVGTAVLACPEGKASAQSLDLSALVESVAAPLSAEDSTGSLATVAAETRAVLA